MSNKILLTTVLAVSLAFGGSALATDQNSDDQAVDSNRPDQLERVQQRLQDATATDTGVENELNNRNELNDIKDENTTTASTTPNNKGGSPTALEKRSPVASAVQELLSVAGRSGGIGEQVRVIAQTQNQNQQELDLSLQKIQGRSGFVKFFVGPNYGEINNVQKILDQNTKQIQQLNQIKDQLPNQADQQVLTQQVKVLQQANAAIQDSLNTSEQGFSLLGWLFRIFAK